jgi:hypothetical protein
MSWTYDIRSGVMRQPDGTVSGIGYSGAVGFKNDPANCQLKMRGPIPPGFYTITKPSFNDPTHGPVVMRLTPDPANNMYGRDGFMIHGDSIEHPGAASEGCIILSRPVREDIEASPDAILQVI